MEKDGYNALQIALTEAKEKHVGKAMRGHFAKAGTGFSATRVKSGFRARPSSSPASSSPWTSSPPAMWSR